MLRDYIQSRDGGSVYRQIRKKIMILTRRGVTRNGQPSITPHGLLHGYVAGDQILVGPI